MTALQFNVLKELSSNNSSDTYRQRDRHTQNHLDNTRKCLLDTSKTMQFTALSWEGCIHYTTSKFACGVANEAYALTVSSVSLETECCFLTAATSQLPSPQETSKRKFNSNHLPEDDGSANPQLHHHWGDKCFHRDPCLPVFALRNAASLMITLYHSTGLARGKYH